MGKGHQDFRLVQRKTAEEDKTLPQMILGPCGAYQAGGRAHDCYRFMRERIVSIRPGCAVDGVLQHAWDGIIVFRSSYEDSVGGFYPGLEFLYLLHGLIFKILVVKRDPVEIKCLKFGVFRKELE